jgi:hypothetical protein
MIPVYQAGRQLIKVRILMTASLVCLGFSLWWAFELTLSHGLNPGDGGVLAPLVERLAVGGVVAVLGIAFAAGMCVYGRVYAARMEFDPGATQIHLETVGFLGAVRHVIPVEDLGSFRARGRVNWNVVVAATVLGHPVPLVDAPWTSVRIAGWRLPLIIDHQGNVLHHKLMQTLFGLS